MTKILVLQQCFLTARIHVHNNPPGRIQSTTDVSTSQINVVKMPGPHSFLVLVLVEQGGVGLLSLTLWSVL